MGTLADLAESGDADALSAAIADGAHLDEADDEGNTATHKAAQGEPECLRLLLSHGATVDSANAEGSTPLIEAVKYGDRECVAIILEAGAAMAHLDATGRDALGCTLRLRSLTPRSYAAFEGWRADGALSPADGDDALPPRVRAGKDERRGQLAVRRYPFTRPTIRAVREDFGTAPEDFGSAVCCIIKFRTTWRRVSLFFLSLFVRVGVQSHPDYARRRARSDVGIPTRRNS